MFAVIETGGNQYKVASGDILSVDKLDTEQGKTVNFSNVLLVNDGKQAMIGTPMIKGATVTAEVLEQTRDDKIIVFKKKRRQNYRRKQGHRQYITTIQIKDIKVAGGTVSSAAKEDKKPAKAAKKKAEAPKKAAPAKKAAPKAAAEKKAAPAKKPAAKKPAAKKSPSNKGDK